MNENPNKNNSFDSDIDKLISELESISDKDTDYTDYFEKQLYIPLNDSEPINEPIGSSFDTSSEQINIHDEFQKDEFQANEVQADEENYYNPYVTPPEQNYNNRSNQTQYQPYAQPRYNSQQNYQNNSYNQIQNNEPYYNHQQSQPYQNNYNNQSIQNNYNTPPVQNNYNNASYQNNSQNYNYPNNQAYNYSYPQNQTSTSNYNQPYNQNYNLNNQSGGYYQPNYNQNTGYYPQNTNITVPQYINPPINKPVSEPNWTEEDLNKYDTYAKKTKKSIKLTGNLIGSSIIMYLIFSAIYGAIVLALSQFTNIVDSSGTFKDQEITSQLFNFFANFLVIYLPFFLFALFSKVKFNTIGLNKKPQGKVFFPLLFLSIGIVYIGQIFSTVFSMLLSTVNLQPTMPEMYTPHTPIGIILFFINVAVLPAIFEEIICRGFILQALRKYGDWFAIVVSSIIFGIIHLNLVQAPFAIIMGLILGYTTVKTKSLWLAIILHFINNALSCTLHLISMSGNQSAINIFSICYMLFIVAAGIIGFIWYLIKVNHPLKLENNAVPEKTYALYKSDKFIAITLNVGMIAALLFMSVIISQTLKSV